MIRYIGRWGNENGVVDMSELNLWFIDMKLLIFFFMNLLLTLSSCSEDSAESIPVLQVGADTVVLKNTIDGQNVTVVSSADWEAVVEEECDWCRCIVNKGMTSFVRIETDANNQVEERWTFVTLISGSLKHTIRVCQFGAAPAIITLPAAFDNLSFEPVEFVLQTIANVEVEVMLPDTVAWVNKNREEVGDTVRSYFKTNLNSSVLPRETWITVSHKGGTLVRRVRVWQAGRNGDYEIQSPEEVVRDAKLVIDGSRSGASSVQAGSGDFAKSFDGDMGTLYHSNWSNEGEHYFPITLEYAFATDESELDYLIYYPRTDGPNGRFKQVEISYKKRGDDSYTVLGEVDFGGSASPRKVDFPDGVRNPDKVKFVVKSGAGNGQGFASCAEMEFYRKVVPDVSLTAVFTDETYSALRENVTYEQIQGLENAFYREIAKALFLGIYPLADRVREYEAYADPDWIARRYKINSYNRLDNATGIYVRAGDELVIFCGNTAGQQLGLWVMDWAKGYSGKSYMLIEGVNRINMSSSGLVYVSYYASDPTAAPKVKLHFATGQVNGCFRLGENKDTDWSGLLNKSVGGYLDMQGKYTHMCWPVSKLRSIVTQPTELLEVYDRMVRLEHELMGLYKYDIPIKNRMFFHAVATDDYMYATSYRTAYHENTLSEILNVNKMKSGVAVWGPAHEVGHMHQTRPGLKWIGMTEVTNNIHSLNVETTFGHRSRLMREKMGEAEGGGTRYEKAFTNIIARGIAHNEEGDVFCKLVPFWQLQLYAGKIAGKPDLYPELHESVRNMTDPTGDTKNGVCQLNFVEQCCRVLDEDLTVFFEAWGFLKEMDKVVTDYATERMWVTADGIASVKAKIAGYTDMKLKGLIYLNDENVGLFQNPQAVVPGKVAHNNREVTLSGWENVVAYELCEGDRIIMIAQRETFKVPETYGEIDWAATSIRGVAADGTRVSVAFE